MILKRTDGDHQFDFDNNQKMVLPSPFGGFLFWLKMDVHYILCSFGIICPNKLKWKGEELPPSPLGNLLQNVK